MILLFSIPITVTLIRNLSTRLFEKQASAMPLLTSRIEHMHIMLGIETRMDTELLLMIYGCLTDIGVQMNKGNLFFLYFLNHKYFSCKIVKIHEMMIQMARKDGIVLQMSYLLGSRN